MHSSEATMVNRYCCVTYNNYVLITFSQTNYVIVCHIVAFSALTLLVRWQEGHPARKKYGGDGGGGHWLVRMEWCPAGWSVCLPLLIFPCTIKSRSSLLALAHPGSPGKRDVKRLWCMCHCNAHTAKVGDSK